MNAATIGSNLLAILADHGGPAGLVARCTVLLASSWLAHALLARRNPRWRVLLWRGTIAGMIVVAALSARAPIVSLPVAPPVREVSVEPAVSLAPTAHSEPVRPPALMPVRAVRVEAEAEAETVVSRPKPVLDIEPAAARAPSPTPIVGRVASWLPALWLAGMLILSGRLVLSSLALGRLLRRANDAPQAIVDRCRAIAARLGCNRTPRVVCSQEVAGPCLAGVFRPVLLLPGRADGSTSDDLPAILAHELAHAKNHDLAWNLAAHLASIVLWFHPLAWRIRSAHASACDAVSDAIAADHLGDVVAYGRTLARLAVAAASSPPSPAPVLAMARTSEVWRRLDALNRQVFGAPLSRRLILPAVALGGLLLVLIGGFGITRAAQDPKAARARAKATPEANDPDLPAGRIVLRAVEGATGDPVGGASVEVLLSIGGEAQKSTVKAAEDGTAAIEWKAGAKVERLHVTARAPGFAPVLVVWSRDRHPKGLPAEKVLRLERGVTIGGVVKDAEGRAIAGAKVSLTASATDSDWNEGANFSLATLQTDNRGRWRLEHAPRDLGHIWVSATRPGYRQRAYNTVAAVGSDSVIVLERGLTLTGLVIDAQGRPVRGARAVLTHDSRGSSGPAAASDADGRFTINNCDPGVASLGVQARGFAPLMREVRIEAKMAPVEVRLAGPGKSMRARVVDVAGRPIAGALVVVESWRGRAVLEFRTHTDADGRFAWGDAPADAVLFSILKPGYMAGREVSLQATDREQTVVLHPRLVITGKVTDATTGRPVDGFRIVQGRPIVGEAPTEINWSEASLVQGSNGQYRTEFDEPSERLYVRIEAPGYRIAASRGFRPDEGDRTLDFALEPARSVSGIVKLPDGRPAEAVAVALATPRKHVALHDGRFNGDAGMPRVTTGPDGRFAFAAPEGPFSVIAAGDAGFADAMPDELARSGTLVLQPWGRIEGGLRIGARSGANQEVSFHPNRFRRGVGPFVFSYGYETRTDDRGRFTLDRVIPGPGMVSRVVITALGGGGEMHTPGWNERVEVPPGGTVEVKIGGKGRPVVGRLAIEGTPEFPVDWTKQEPVTLDAGLDQAATAPDRWYRVAANLEKDGSFRIDDVPAGMYRMRLRVNGSLPPGSGDRDAQVGQVERSVEVPPIPGGRSNEPLDLGAIHVQLTDTLKAGDPAPDFTVRRIGEGAGANDRIRLSDNQGKLVLVDFRSSWYEHQSRSDLNAMIELHKTFGGNPRFRMITLWWDRAPEPAEQVITKQALAWTQGFAGPNPSPASAAYKLRSSQATFLVGPDGRILAKNLRGAELRAAIEKALKDESLFRATRWASRPARFPLTRFAEPGPATTGDRPVAFVLDDADADFREDRPHRDVLHILRAAGGGDPKDVAVERVAAFHTSMTGGGVHSLAIDRQRGRIYLVERIANRVVALDFHGRRLWQVDGISAAALAVDPKTGRVWCTVSRTTLAGEVVVLEPTGQEVASFPEPGFDIVYDPHGDGFWLAGDEQHGIIRLTREGRVLFRRPCEGFEMASVEIDPRDGTAWLVERAHPDEAGSANRVWQVDPGGKVLHSWPMGDKLVFSVAVDPKAGTAWVTVLHGGLLRFHPDGRAPEPLPITAATAVAFSPTTGRAWVATESEVLGLDADGRPAIRSPIGPESGQAWLAAY